MAILKHDLLPASVYNTLPNIRELYHVPEANKPDIADLKALLDKHGLGDKVHIKLVHIHFLLEEGEVFAARHVKVPKHGNISIMQPVISSNHKELFGFHYYVDDDGNLSAYEYMERPGPSLTGHDAFIEEFCQVIKARGLQRKFGLSLRHTEIKASIQELEYPAARTCIDVPSAIKIPEGPDSFSTMTEFRRSPRGGNMLPPKQSCGHWSHHKHPAPPPAAAKYPQIPGLVADDSGPGEEDEIHEKHGDIDGLHVIFEVPRKIELAGTGLEPSSDLFGLVS
jgi:hypothetical protein